MKKEKGSKLYLDEYQVLLLNNFWTMECTRGFVKLHIYWKKRIGKKDYEYYEDEISPEDICKKHKIKEDD